MENLASTDHFNLRSDLLRTNTIKEPSASVNPVNQCGFKFNVLEDPNSAILLIVRFVAIIGLIFDLVKEKGVKVEEKSMIGPLQLIISKGLTGSIPSGGH